MSKRQEMREKKAKQERTNRILIIIGVTLIVFAAGLFIILPNLPKPVGDVTVPDADPRPQAQFNTAGDPNAPVKMIEISDFQCPYCEKFWKDGTERQIMETYVATGKVHFEYRTAGEFIGGPSGESIRAGEAAYCAGDQNKFWEMHDIIFANQNGENKGAFNDARLIAFAEKIGVNLTTFKDCFTGGKYNAKVKQDEVNAARDIQGATNFNEMVAAGQYSPNGFSTPTFLVNGRIVSGALPFSEFQKEIDAALAAVQK